MSAFLAQKKQRSLLTDVDSHAHATMGVSQTAIENTATVVPALVDRGLETEVVFEAIRQVEDGFDFVSHRPTVSSATPSLRMAVNLPGRDE